jgi:acetolactate synthase-1/2/3 large subunit
MIGTELTMSMSGGRFIAETLHGYGVDHVFFMDAILRSALAEMEALDIRRILVHSEKAAAYMADGYARVGRKPAICMAQSVGAANLASGLQDPYLGRSAVIALTGRQPAIAQYRNSYQEVPHGPLFSSVTKMTARVDVPEQLPTLLRQAFREATSGTPRPVHLDIAGHTGEAIGSASRPFSVIRESAFARVPAYRTAPDSGRDVA